MLRPTCCVSFLILGLSYTFIQKININGVGYAFLVTYAVLTLIIMAQSWREKPFSIKDPGENQEFAGSTRQSFEEPVKTTNPGGMNMKAFSKEKDRFALTEKAVFYLLIILAIAGMTAPILFGDYNLSLLGSYLGIPMILAPIIWYKVKKNPDKTINGKPELGYICSILFFVCYSASILVLYFYPVRSIEYYLLVTIMGMCILGQILFAGEVSSKARTAILIQTILLMLNIIWGVNLKYYFFIGRTDIIHHSWLAKNLMNTGHISEAFEIYAASPCGIFYVRLSPKFAVYPIPRTQ